MAVVVLVVVVVVWAEHYATATRWVE